MKRIVLYIAVFVLVAIALIGCGGAGQDPIHPYRGEWNLRLDNPTLTRGGGDEAFVAGTIVIDNAGKISTVTSDWDISGTLKPNGQIDLTIALPTRGGFDQLQVSGLLQRNGQSLMGQVQGELGQHLLTLTPRQD